MVAGGSGCMEEEVGVVCIGGGFGVGAVGVMIGKEMGHHWDGVNCRGVEGVFVREG